MLTNESGKGSLILFLKDIDKSVSGNTEVYVTLKSKLEKLPENVVVIASQTQLDNRKEKVEILFELYFCMLNYSYLLFKMIS